MTLPLALLGAPTISQPVRAVLRSLGIDPGDPCLEDRLRLTPAGKLRPLLGTSTKIRKGEKKGILTSVMYLSPSTESGINTCPLAGSCASMCIRDVGRMQFDQSTRSRVHKTLFWHLFPDQFLAQLRGEILRLARKADRLGMIAAVRLNGTSDILWERTDVIDFALNAGVVPYDYSKIDPVKRNRKAPTGYHLTFSVDEKPGSLAMAEDWLRIGGNAAVVVQAQNGSTLATAKQAQQTLLDRGSWRGFPVVSGDETDYRPADPYGAWVILHAKGPACKSGIASGFVQGIQL